MCAGEKGAEPYSITLAASEFVSKIKLGSGNDEIELKGSSFEVNHSSV